MSDEHQTLRTAISLTQSGILTQRAARALSYFSSHGVFCEPMRLPSGELGIIFRERWYTPPAFNALMEGRYAPTTNDVAVAITAFPTFAAEPAEDPQDPEGDGEPEEGEPEDDAAQTPDPDGVVEGLRSGYSGGYSGYGKDAAAEARLDALYQASSQRTDGEGGLTWAIAIAVVGGALFIGVMVWAFFNGAWR